MSKAHGVDLLQGEEVDLVVKPHPISFIKYHLVAVYLIVVTVFLGWFYFYLKSNLPLLDTLNAIFGTIPGLYVEDIALLLVFWAILLLSGLIIGVLWVSKMPLLYMVLVGAAGTALELYFLAPYDLALIQKPLVKLWLLGVAAVLGMILTEVYRRGHVFIITNYRIIMKKGFIGKEEREIMYDKITDVYVNQGIMGRIFNFGTVIPISASGFGLGEDSASAFAGAAVPVKKGMIGGGFSGGKSVQRPRAATYFSLYGVPDPRRIRIIVGNRQQEAREAPILRRIENILKEKQEKIEKNDEKDEKTI